MLVSLREDLAAAVLLRDRTESPIPVQNQPFRRAEYRHSLPKSYLVEPIFGPLFVRKEPRFSAFGAFSVRH